MQILFTKKSIQKEVLSILSNNIQSDFIDFITIQMLQKRAFHLDSQSLIFTSSNSVKSFFENGFQIQNNKIYCVGKKTAKEFLERKVDVFRTETNAGNLTKYIVQNSKNEHFIHFCGNLSLDILEIQLLENHIHYRKEVIYETQLLFPKIEKNYDAVVFFSPSGVRSFAKFNSLEDFTLFSIGKTTESELKHYTQKPIISSEQNDLNDLLELIIKEAKTHD